MEMLMFMVGAVTMLVVMVVVAGIACGCKARKFKRRNEIAEIAVATIPTCARKVVAEQCVLCGKQGFVDDMKYLNEYVSGPIAYAGRAHTECVRLLRAGEHCPLCGYTHKNFKARAAVIRTLGKKSRNKPNKKAR